MRKLEPLQLETEDEFVLKDDNDTELSTAVKNDRMKEYFYYWFNEYKKKIIMVHFSD